MSSEVPPPPEVEVARATLPTCHVVAAVTVLLAAFSLVAEHYGVGRGLQVDLRHPQPLLLVPLLTSGGLGLMILYLSLPLRPKEALVVVLTGTLYEGGLYSWRQHVAIPALAEQALGVGWGSAAWLALLWRLRQAQGPERLVLRCYAWAGALLPLSLLAGGVLQLLAMQAHPQVRDLYAYLVDYSLGFSPSFLLASLVRQAGLDRLACLFYQLLSAWVLSAFVLSFRGRRVYFDLMACACLGGLLGTVLYNVYPLVGATELFGSYPSNSPQAPLFSWPEPPYPPQEIPAPAHLPRNSMPSLHTAWVLMAYLCFCRQRSWWLRIWGALFTLMTMAGVFYLGHYLVDVVVAFPFLLGTLGLSARRQWVPGPLRLAAVLVGYGLTGLCLWALLNRWDFLFHHGLVTMGLEAAVMAVSVLLELLMYRSALRGAEGRPG